LADVCRKGDGRLLLGTTAAPADCTRGPASAALRGEMMRGLALVESHADDRLDELLSTALEQIERGTEVVLVSTRPVDLSDTGRFVRTWSDPARRRALRQVRTIDASSPELAEYFQIN
jgi:hypothetical protein